MLFVTLYFLLFLMISVTSRFSNNMKARQVYQLFFCFAALFVIFGFRDIPVLNDTPHYYGFYYMKARSQSYLEQSIFAFNILDRFEYGFQVLVHFLIKYVSKDAYTIIWLSALIITIGNLWFVKKYTNDIAMGIFFLIISGEIIMHYCVIRQSIAVIIFYIAFGYLEKDRNIPYCILVILATLFHTSAIFLLAIPLLKKLSINKRNIILLMGATLVTGVLILQLMAIFGLTDSLYYKKAMSKQTMSLAAVFAVLLMAIILLVCIMIHKKMRLKSINPTYFWTCFFGWCICMLTPFLFVFSRVNLFIWPIIIIQLLRYVSPEYRFKDEMEPVDNVKPLRQVKLRRAAQIFVAITFTTKTIGLMLLRPEWSHFVPYSFYDFTQRYHDYHMYFIF